jgi:acyl CoA:acetate/3-ketoacid CoA transferase beta subunit/acyl CoA:acetate/3-ketoacid CoA transferase alpha subunit
VTNRSKVSRLDDAIRAHVEPEMHLNFASTPSRSNAAVRELARAFRGRAPRFVISATGFHSSAHLLAMLRLGRTYVTCFVGDNYPIPRPNALYSKLSEEGSGVELWSLGSYVAALRAGALGHPYAITRSLVGTDMGADLQRVGAFRQLPEELEAAASSTGSFLPSDRAADPAVGLVRALRPDIVFLHALFGDERGNLIFSPPYSEGLWGAHAATKGVVATVERIVSGAESARFGDALRLPSHRVLAVCEEPFGAHPQPVYAAPRFGVAGYIDDFAHYERWRELSSGRGVDAFSSAVLDAEDGGNGYRAWVGNERLARLADEAAALSEAVREARAAGVRPTPRCEHHHPGSHDDDVGRIPPLGPRSVRDSNRPDAPARPNEILIALAARKIAERVRERGYPVILAGIGHAFLAARMAKQWLEESGVSVRVMVETGLFDVECGPSTDEFLLSYRNAALAGGLSSVEDILATLTCGATARCLGVLGAAQVDATGALNSTRAEGKLLVGSGGANDIASCAEEVVVLARCTAKRLVTKVDYVTSPGRAVRNVVTDMCVLSREATDSTTWAVDDVYAVLGGRPPSFVLDAIRQSCPWSLRVPEDTEYAPLISTAEMALIHSLDPEGIHWRREPSRIG